MLDEVLSSEQGAPEQQVENAPRTNRVEVEEEVPLQLPFGLRIRILDLKAREALTARSKSGLKPWLEEGQGTEHSKGEPQEAEEGQGQVVLDPSLVATQHVLVPTELIGASGGLVMEAEGEDSSASAVASIGEAGGMAGEDLAAMVAQGTPEAVPDLEGAEQPKINSFPSGLGHRQANPREDGLPSPNVPTVHQELVGPALASRLRLTSVGESPRRIPAKEVVGLQTGSPNWLDPDLSPVQVIEFQEVATLNKLHQPTVTPLAGGVEVPELTSGAKGEEQLGLDNTDSDTAAAPTEELQPVDAGFDEGQVQDRPAAAQGQIRTEDVEVEKGETAPKLRGGIPERGRAPVAQDETQTMAANQTAPPAPQNLEDGLETSMPVRSTLDVEQTEEVVPKLVETLEMLVTDERSEVRIELKPEHLGELRIKLSMERGIMVAEFMVQDRRVQELLSAQLPQLYTALQEQGTVLSDVSINIGLGQEQQTGQEQPQGRTPDRSVQPRQETPAVRGTVRYSGGSSWYQVDIRA